MFSSEHQALRKGQDIHGNTNQIHSKNEWGKKINMADKTPEQSEVVHFIKLGYISANSKDLTCKQD